MTCSKYEDKHSGYVDQDSKDNWTKYICENLKWVHGTRWFTSRKTRDFNLFILSGEYEPYMIRTLRDLPDLSEVKEMFTFFF